MMTGCTILILLIHKQERFSILLYHLQFTFHLKFSFQVFYFLSKIHSKIIFEAIVNGMIFLISFSACLYLVYKKDTGYCGFILSLAALMLTLIILGVFLWILLASFMYIIMPSIRILWFLLSLYSFHLLHLSYFSR